MFSTEIKTYGPESTMKTASTFWGNTGSGFLGITVIAVGDVIRGIAYPLFFLGEGVTGVCIVKGFAIMILSISFDFFKPFFSKKKKISFFSNGKKKLFASGSQLGDSESMIDKMICSTSLLLSVEKKCKQNSRKALNVIWYVKGIGKCVIEKFEGSVGCEELLEN